MVAGGEMIFFIAYLIYVVLSVLYLTGIDKEALNIGNMNEYFIYSHLLTINAWILVISFIGLSLLALKKIIRFYEIVYSAMLIMLIIFLEAFIDKLINFLKIIGHIFNIYPVLFMSSLSFFIILLVLLRDKYKKEFDEIFGFLWIVFVFVIIVI